MFYSGEVSTCNRCFSVLDKFSNNLGQQQLKTLDELIYKSRWDKCWVFFFFHFVQSLLTSCPNEYLKDS